MPRYVVALATDGDMELKLQEASCPEDAVLSAFLEYFDGAVDTDSLTLDELKDAIFSQDAMIEVLEIPQQ